MLAYLKQLKQENQRSLLQRLYFSIVLLLLTQISCADFSINFAEVHLQDKVYLMDADLDYTLTEKAIEALNNGVTLTLVLSITIERDRQYWWNETIVTLTQRYQLKYHALGRQYVVKYLNTGIQETFPNLSIALRTIGKLKDFPLLDKQMIKPAETYRVYLQNYLDIESLPVPLRPLAYLSSQWQLSSQWYLCPLQPPKPE